MAKFGFKEITPANLLERDPVLIGFVKLSSNGLSRILTIDDYLSYIFTPCLLEVVPRDVQALFEVARGAMAYGYFFYPLFTLAMEQLFRVAEAAVAHKYTALGAPKSTRNFKGRIDRLVDEGIIPRAEVGLWDAIRELRNMASHPERQMVGLPNMAIGILERVASQINSLFNSKPIQPDTE
jgi:hypothetical protein